MTSIIRKLSCVDSFLLYREPALYRLLRRLFAHYITTPAAFS